MSPENCDKCGANFEAILDWREGKAERERQMATLQAELERTKLARNAAEAKLAEAEKEDEVWRRNHRRQLQRAEATEAEAKALREAAGELCAAAAEAFVVRDSRGMAALPALVAKVRALIPGAIATALAIGEEESCAECGGRGFVEWTASEHDPRCDGTCAVGCPVPVPMQGPCPSCGGAALAAWKKTP